LLSLTTFDNIICSFALLTVITDSFFTFLFLAAELLFLDPAVL